MQLSLQFARYLGCAVIAFCCCLFVNSAKAGLAQGNSPYGASATASSAQQELPPGMIEVDGEFAFVIQGQFTDPQGKQIDDAKIVAKVVGIDEEYKVAGEVINGRYKIRIPLDRPCFNIVLNASDEQDDLHWNRMLSSSELRAVARDGLDVQLEKASRIVRIHAQFDGQPVPEANVFVDFGNGYQMKSKCDSNGIASISCLPGKMLTNVTVWKGTEFVGGHGSRGLARVDQESDDYIVKLYRTQPQKIQFKDLQGNPVAGIEFGWAVATREPQIDYLGTHDVFRLESDENGEAIADWFPVLENPHSNVRIRSKDWVTDNPIPPLKDGVYEIVVRKSLGSSRVKIDGRVETDLAIPVAGFNIELRSFQGVAERRGDIVRAFTKPDGTFTANVLPGSTYCYYLNDVELVSQPKDALLYEPLTKETNQPTIQIEKGVEVEVIATHGLDRKPYANLTINLSRDHNFSWIEERGNRLGSVGKSYRVETDEQGRASVVIAPGFVEFSAYAPDWRYEGELTVGESDVDSIVVHRPILEPLTVSGRLDNSKTDAKLANASVLIAAYDGRASGQQTVIANENGVFEFEANATTLALYAYTGDGLASGFSIIELDKPIIELKLQPTSPYYGRLLDENGKPLLNHTVSAKISVSEEFDPMLRVPRHIEGGVISTRTDAEGYYTFEGMPVGVRFTLSAKSSSGEGEKLSMGERFVVQGEERPLDVVRVGSSESITPARTTRYVYDALLRNCKLYDLSLLVVIPSDDVATKLAQRMINNYDNRAVLGYMTQLLTVDQINNDPVTVELMKEKGWDIPKPGHCLFIAIDLHGNEVARVALDAREADAESKAIDFTVKHEPAAKDAAQALANAIKLAKQSGRTVWALHGGTRCGPCFRLSRWIDDHQEILDKYFVFVKVDASRDKNGIEVAKRITRNRSFGIPFVAIFDSEGEILADSESPLGNIGYPSSYEGALHLRRMIQAAAPKMTEEEIELILEPLLREIR